MFPGLRPFVSAFAGQRAMAPAPDVIAFLDRVVLTTDFATSDARDFALFDSGRQVFDALYSVGFIGVRDRASGRFAFCHDGSASAPDSDLAGIMTTIHPCYWKALTLRGDAPPEAVAIQINDEYSPVTSNDFRDLRTKRLGTVLGELPRLPLGADGSAGFERWVYRALGILFSGKLSNIELKPGAGAIQRRDIVATNLATDGFWKRVRDDYQSRQVVVEVKNYEEMSEDDFRQVLSYTGNQYGRFAMIVSRTSNELLTPREVGWVRELWFSHERIVMIVPAPFLARCLAKVRNPSRYDYPEDAFNKRLDFVERSQLSLAHQKTHKEKRRAQRKRNRSGD